MGHPSHKGLNRRQLVAAVGAGSALVATGALALPRTNVPRWDLQVDVLVAGSGVAGACAAIESKTAGASVLVVEALSVPGGSSALSGGVVYAGGGTSLQRALKVQDSPEAMFQFLTRAG